MLYRVLNQLFNVILLFDAAGNESASVFPESNEDFVVSGPEPLWKTIGKWVLLGVVVSVGAYLYWKEAGGTIVSDAVVVAPSVATSVATSVAPTIGTTIATIFGHTVNTVAVVQEPTLDVSRKICIVVSVAIMKSLNESELLLQLAYYTSLNETGLAMTSQSVAQSITIPVLKVVPPVLTPIIEAVVNTSPTLFTPTEEQKILFFKSMHEMYLARGTPMEMRTQIEQLIDSLEPYDYSLAEEALKRLPQNLKMSPNSRFSYMLLKSSKVTNNYVQNKHK